jgi:hypothetical protein
MFTKETALIIPTRNRPNLLRNLLLQISQKNFNQIIIIDSSDSINKFKVKNICNFYFAEYYTSYPSTSYQRNIGLNKVKKNNKFIMFADDDIFFFKNSFLEMNKVIKYNIKNLHIAGFGFNLINSNSSSNFDFLKKSWLASKLNLYSNEAGKVTKSGWHTKITNLKSNKVVDWLYTGASIYKYNIIKNIRFDITLGRYSYLEDLDFSLMLKKKFIISYKAKFIHPNYIERITFSFGIIEIVNRYKLVQKHNLSKFSFFLGAFLRFFISFLLIFIKNYKFIFRSFGNFIGILNCILISLLRIPIISRNK